MATALNLVLFLIIEGVPFSRYNFSDPGGQLKAVQLKALLYYNCPCNRRSKLSQQALPRLSAFTSNGTLPGKAPLVWVHIFSSMYWQNTVKSLKMAHRKRNSAEGNGDRKISRELLAYFTNHLWQIESFISIRL